MEEKCGPNQQTFVFQRYKFFPLKPLICEQKPSVLMRFLKLCGREAYFTEGYIFMNFKCLGLHIALALDHSPKDQTNTIGGLVQNEQGKQQKQKEQTQKAIHKETNDTKQNQT